MHDDDARQPVRNGSAITKVERNGRMGNTMQWNAGQALNDLEQAAKAALPEYVYGYFAGTAGGGESVQDAAAQWGDVRFRPRAFTRTSSRGTATSVLGVPLQTPVLAAPMAQQNAATPLAELATARAVRRTGSLLGVSTNTSVPFAKIAAEGVPWWFQVYVMKDRGLSDALVERAAAAGARALLLTVDTTRLSSGGLIIDPLLWPEVPGKTRLANLLEEDLSGLPGGATEAAGDLTLDVISDLRERSGLEVVVKGILRGDDARRAVDAGAAGVLVSTHGGRRLGRSVTSIQALPEVVQAVGGDCEVYVDSGIRTGDHIAASLAMGARAVFVGRPMLWGLATGGEDGAAAVLGGLTEELRATMAGIGADSIADITADLL
ncbi:alpha-hydroxy-acid oxidizing protein [Arthrobacter zhaoxinii]|uniref:Alpha-hydroxy-acid oxidizing protein n=1 Tax=Arthrobacter zhaoxinii TaxID=2964616 RepID=A0ABY5YUG3_9MICC|nr:alpha-hydroxy acid oxidase [Arthrobacter zhaoxinii]UWX98447.1 alpha-hydroxy-acid oxidizing protein [Arthrobacter zhaoxinii]